MRSGCPAFPCFARRSGRGQGPCPAEAHAGRPTFQAVTAPTEIRWSPASKMFASTRQNYRREIRRERITREKYRIPPRRSGVPWRSWSFQPRNHNRSDGGSGLEGGVFAVPISVFQSPLAGNFGHFFLSGKQRRRTSPKKGNPRHSEGCLIWWRRRVRIYATASGIPNTAPARRNAAPFPHARKNHWPRPGKTH